MKQIFIILFSSLILSLFGQSEPFPSFRIEPSRTSAVVGDTIEYKVVATNFTKVIGIQWGLTWDTSAIEIVSTQATMSANANPNLGISSQSFNVTKSFIAFSTVFFDLEGVSILPGQDSVVFAVKAIAVKNSDSPDLCFSNDKVISELVFLDAKGNEVAPSGKIVNCRNVKFDPNQLVLTAEGIKVFNQFTTAIKLSYTLKNGYPPYHSDWGIAKDVDSLTILPPSADSVYTVKVWDASNDTIFYTFYLRYFQSKIQGYFSQEYVTVGDSTKIKLNVNYSNNTGKVRVDWGNIQDVRSIIIAQPTKDSTYQVYLYDDLDTIGYLFFIKPLKALSWTAVDFTSIVPFVNAQVGMKILVNSVGLVPPLQYLCPGSLKVDSSTFVVPCDGNSYVVTAVDANGSTISRNLSFKKITPNFILSNGAKLLIDQTNTTILFHPGIFPYKQPFRYLWQNGDTTPFSKIRRPNKDSTYYSLSIVDASGLAVRDSILIVFDVKPVCRGFSEYKNSQIITKFQKNPRFGELTWRYEIMQNNMLVKQAKGKTNEEVLSFNYENNSSVDTADFALTYSMKGKDFLIAEQVVRIKILPKTVPKLSKNIQPDLRFCALDSAIYIRSGVYGGAPPLTYRWSTGQEGQNLDSIMVRPLVSTKYQVTVTDAAGATIINSTNIAIGDSAKIFQLALADSVCPMVSIPNLTQPFVPFTVYSTLFKYDGEQRVDSTNITLPYGSQIHQFLDYSNRVNEQAILTVKFNKLEYCLDGRKVELSDTVILRPTPKFSGRAGVKDSICVGDSIILDRVDGDPTNLASTKLEYHHSVWISDIIEGSTIVEEFTGKDRVQYKSIPRISLQYFNENNWWLNEIVWKLQYDFNGCIGFDNKRVDSIFTFSPSTLDLYSKYQTVNAGQSIQPILITTNAEKLSYEWVYAKNVIEGTALDSRGTLIKGTLTNIGFKPQLVKLLLGAESRTCPTIWDTAYLLVQPKFVPTDEILKESNVFQVGSGKFWQVYPELPSTVFTDISVVPNPTLDHLTVNFELQLEQHLAGEIYTLSGKRVKYFTYAAGTGVHQLQLDVADLPQGLYLLRLSGPNYHKTAPFIKE